MTSKKDPTPGSKTDLFAPPGSLSPSGSSAPPAPDAKPAPSSNPLFPSEDPAALFDDLFSNLEAGLPTKPMTPASTPIKPAAPSTASKPATSPSTKPPSATPTSASSAPKTAASATASAPTSASAPSSSAAKPSSSPAKHASYTPPAKTASSPTTTDAPKKPEDPASPPISSTPASASLPTITPPSASTTAPAKAASPPTSPSASKPVSAASPKEIPLHTDKTDEKKDPSSFSGAFSRGSSAALALTPLPPSPTAEPLLEQADTLPSVPSFQNEKSPPREFKDVKTDPRMTSYSVAPRDVHDFVPTESQDVKLTADQRNDIAARQAAREANRHPKPPAPRPEHFDPKATRNPFDTDPSIPALPPGDLLDEPDEIDEDTFSSPPKKVAGSSFQTAEFTSPSPKEIDAFTPLPAPAPSALGNSFVSSSSPSTDTAAPSSSEGRPTPLSSKGASSSQPASEANPVTDTKVPSSKPSSLPASEKSSPSEPPKPPADTKPTPPSKPALFEPKPSPADLKPSGSPKPSTPAESKSPDAKPAASAPAKPSEKPASSTDTKAATSSTSNAAETPKSATTSDTKAAETPKPATTSDTKAAETPKSATTSDTKAAETPKSATTSGTKAAETPKPATTSGTKAAEKPAVTADSKPSDAKTAAPAPMSSPKPTAIAEPLAKPADITEAKAKVSPVDPKASLDPKPLSETKPTAAPVDPKAAPSLASDATPDRQTAPQPKAITSDASGSSAKTTSDAAKPTAAQPEPKPSDAPTAASPKGLKRPALLDKLPPKVQALYDRHEERIQTAVTKSQGLWERVSQMRALSFAGFFLLGLLGSRIFWPPIDQVTFADYIQKPLQTKLFAFEKEKDLSSKQITRLNEDVSNLTKALKILQDRLTTEETTRRDAQKALAGDLQQKVIEKIQKQEEAVRLLKTGSQSELKAIQTSIQKRLASLEASLPPKLEGLRSDIEGAQKTLDEKIASLAADAKAQKATLEGVAPLLGAVETKLQKRLQTLEASSQAQISQTRTDLARATGKFQAALVPVNKNLASLQTETSNHSKALNSMEIRSRSHAWQLTRITSDFQPFIAGYSRINELTDKLNTEFRTFQRTIEADRWLIKTLKDAFPSMTEMLKTVSSQSNTQQKVIADMEITISNFRKTLDAQSASLQAAIERQASTLNKVDLRSAQVVDRFEGLALSLQTEQQNLAALGSKFSGLQQNLAALEKRTQEIAVMLQPIAKASPHHTRQIAALQTALPALQAALASLQKETSRNFQRLQKDGKDGQIEAQKKAHEITKRLRSTEEELKRTLASVASASATLKAHSSSLQGQSNQITKQGEEVRSLSSSLGQFAQQILKQITELQSTAHALPAEIKRLQERLQAQQARLDALRSPAPSPAPRAPAPRR